MLNKILDTNDEETEYFESTQNELYFSSNDYIRMGVRAVDRSLDKMLKGSETLGRVCLVNKGIVTGCDKVSQKHLQQYDLTIPKGSGVFVITEEQLELLDLNAFERERIRPWYKNSEIRKYTTNISSSLYLIDVCYPADRSLSLRKIPGLISHLEQFKTILENRKTTANGLDKVLKNGFWWTLESKRKVDFDGPKIVTPQRSKTNTFGYNEIPWYASADVYFITAKRESNRIDLKYVLGVLNSKLCYKWLYYLLRPRLFDPAVLRLVGP